MLTKFKQILQAINEHKGNAATFIVAHSAFQRIVRQYKLIVLFLASICYNFLLPTFGRSIDRLVGWLAFH